MAEKDFLDETVMGRFSELTKADQKKVIAKLQKQMDKPIEKTNSDAKADEEKFNA